MTIIKKNNEIYLCKERKNFNTISKKNLNFIKKKALVSKRKRARICVHKNENEPIHEMFIYHPKNTYVRPHKNLLYDESFLLIEGRADLIIFNENGKIKNVVKIDKNNFYYKLKKNIYHMQIFYKNSIFFEVTKGPFKKKNNIFARWSPDEKIKSSITSFQNKISKELKIFNKKE